MNLTFARDVLSFIDTAPTPFHAVRAARDRLTTAGFTVIDEAAPWPDAAGRYALERDGALVAWVGAPDPAHGFTILGAHTDSPNLRLKPRPETACAGVHQLGVEVYGGVLLNSWLDRDLGLAGRVVADGRSHLIRIDRPILRIPQLAIHLDRDVTDKGLKLNAQQHMAPVWGLTVGEDLRQVVADEADLDPATIDGFTLMCHDLQPGAVVGLGEEMIASARLDNLLSCHVAVETLVAVAEKPGASVPMIALFDHEEVGSGSAAGARGALLQSVVERCVAAAGGGVEELRRSLANSFVVSCDNAHATHPNYSERHEPDHPIALNAGPVIKHNANERYATSATSAAIFVDACRRAQVPHQEFVNRTDLACGSTIGPAAAAALGVDTIDVGVPQWAMHSIRETAGTADAEWLHAALVELIRSR